MSYIPALQHPVAPVLAGALHSAGLGLLPDRDGVELQTALQVEAVEAMGVPAENWS